MTDQSWVMGYDVVCPRRLAKVHRMMCGYATPLEYSLFLLEGTQALRDRCWEQLLDLIDQGEDDARCYVLPARGVKGQLGKEGLPQGIVWAG